MLYLVLVNGLIDSFNPCAIGVLIFYMALLISLRVERRLFLAFGFFYIAATYATYLLIGLGILKVMHLFGVHDFFGWAAAVLVIALGLFNIKDYFWPNWRIPYLSEFLNRCHIPKWKPEITVVSALVLGVLVGLCEFPCSGAIYLATVSMLSVKATFMQGLGYLLIYNTMFVLPLVLMFVFVGNSVIFRFLKKVQTSSIAYIKLVMGISMLVSGILLLVWLIK